MILPEVLIKKIEQFDLLRGGYIHPRDNYNETKLRQDYLDHLFTALGWDVYNNNRCTEKYRDVSLEQPIKIKNKTEFIDYTFKIGKEIKFIVEAKAPKIRIKDNKDAADQVRRYAWNAAQPLCILTNFDEFAIYDCTIKPLNSDSPSKGRIKYFTYKELPEEWEFLSSIFSKQSIVSGLFDAFAESSKGKSGTTKVGDEFLIEIEKWRLNLARNIALRNTQLSNEAINESTQSIIDRIIFLRICEDRGLEEKETLKSLLDSASAYEDLCVLFKRADKKYNSGIFYFAKESGRGDPDERTLTLKIDTKTIKDIIRQLYFPESPYEFDIIPPAVLGQVYEQFLGKVIYLTPTHRAEVIYKPEVRKAGGVFYTPHYIVDYTVQHTLEDLVKDKTPTDVVKIKVLDPACGSGSFLLGAYQYLLDWHLEWYIKNLVPLLNLAALDSRTDKKILDNKIRSLLKEPITGSGETTTLIELPIYNPGYSDGIQFKDRTRSDWKLTISEKKRILINNIFGVDIDHQAVEVTKLSLLLKVLEGEKEENIDKNLELYAEKALPNIDQNIKCGNSLIGYDIVTPDIPFDDIKKINPFNWEKEFSSIMNTGGFDAIIGNPPWGATFSELELKYLKNKYPDVVDRMVDSYIYFIGQSIKLLKTERHPIGFIIPSTILNQTDTTSIRKKMLNHGLSHLISLGEGIFTKKVLNTSTILIMQSLKEAKNFVLSDLSKVRLEVKAIALNKPTDMTDWIQWKDLVEKDPDCTFFVNKIESTELLDRLRESHILLERVIEGTIQRGVSPDVKDAHVISKGDAKKHDLENDLLHESLSGSQIKRYQPWFSDQLIIYTTKKTPIHNYPNIENYLKQFKKMNTCKEVKENKHPYWSLHRPRNIKIFQSPKFIGLTTTKSIELIYDESSSLFVTDAMYVFSIKENVNPWALMAVLQSKSFLFLYRVANQGESRVIPQVKASKLNSVPIPSKLLENNGEVSTLEQYCKQLLDYNKKLQNTGSQHEKMLLSRQIEEIDKQIDQLVTKLYGLTGDEVKMIEVN